MNKNQQQAARVYYIIHALTEFASAVMFTTYALYYVQQLGLNPLQLVLVGTFLELVVFVFEIPTGIVADSYSRRLSVIIAFFVMGFAFLLQGGIPFLAEALPGAVSLFAMVVVAEMIRGVGETFLSGAETAWIADEVGEERMGKLFVRAKQIRQIAAIAGIVASVALAGIQLYLPFMAGGVMYLLLALYLCFAMPETNFVPAPRENRNSWQTMGATFRDGARVVRARPVLILILGISLFLGASSEGFDRLWEAFLINDIGLPEVAGWSPVVWFGIIAICGMLLGIAVNEISARKFSLDKRDQVEKLMLICTGLKALGIAAFALAGNLGWALLGYWALIAVDSLLQPVYTTWLNQNVESRTRATVLSFMSQSNAFGQMSGGPVVGWVGVRSTVRVSLLFTAALLLPVLYGFAKVRRKQSAKEQD